MAEITPLRTSAETGLSALFDRLKGSLPGDLAVREQALAGFAERGLPHRRVEEFKYTDVRALMRDAAPPAEPPSSADLAVAFNESSAFSEIGAVRLTFVNGHLADELSEIAALPPGLEATRLTEALTAGHLLLARLGTVETARPNPLYQLNTVFMADGIVIRVPAGTVLDQPLHLRFLNAAATAFSTAVRVLVVVEAGATATFLETHEGSAASYQTNDVVEFVVGDGAKVRHVRLNAEGTDVLALSTLTASLGADVSFNTLNVSAGASASRHQVFVHFAGENTHARIDGVGMLKGRQHVDATLVIDHAVPHCTSREMFKTALDGDSTGVFQGKIIVRPQAQKTDGGMKSDSILLGEGATMYNKPELEIFADDVVCGHGATCGALNDDLLFYLKSRGLPPVEAERLLIQAFLGEAIETVEHEGVHDALVAILEGWLRSRG